MSEIDTRSLFFDMPEIEYHFKYNDLNMDIGKLCLNNKFSDFKFIIKQGSNYRQFDVHRAILAIRSPRFDSWFDGPLGNEDQAFLEPGVIDPEIFKEILEHIYSETYPEKYPDKVYEYLAAATEFQMTQLQEKYEEDVFKKIVKYPVSEMIPLTFKYMREEIAALTQQAFSDDRKLSVEAIEQFDMHFPHLSEMMHVKVQQQLNLATECEVYRETSKRYN